MHPFDYPFSIAPSTDLNRRQWLRQALSLSAIAATAGLPMIGNAQSANQNAKANAKMLARAIPSSGESLPVIGCGTWVGFGHAPGSAEYQRLPGVLKALFEASGRVIDSSPMYGRSEQTTGELLAQSTAQSKPFLATKVWIRGREAGIEQMEQSLAHLKTKSVDLMQIHNLLDWRTQLGTLRDWKEKGRIRYLGITHYTSSAYEEVEAVLRGEKLDFLQINYSMDDRVAEQRLLPLAKERGVAVIINKPFGGGGLLRSLRDKPLPAWAADIGCTSWAQVLLKFTLSHPAVTCAIPGTSRPEHMADNARAGFGLIPDAAFWRKHAVS